MKLFLTLVFFSTVAILPAQWINPRPIDSISTTGQTGAKAAISKDGKIAVALRENGLNGSIVIYLSTDNGNSFVKKGSIKPDAIERGLWEPDGMEFDNNDNLYLLWRWTKYYETIPINHYGLLSKSSDFGTTFKTIYPFTDGMNSFFKKMLFDAKTNSIHLIRDSIDNVGKKKGVAYTRVENGNENKIFTALASLTSPGTTNADFTVQDDSVIHIVFDSSWRSVDNVYHSRIMYIKSVDGGKTFVTKPTPQYDTVKNTSNSKIIIGDNKRIHVFYAIQDSEDIVMVTSEDGGNTFGFPRSVIWPNHAYNYFVHADNTFFHFLYYNYSAIKTNRGVVYNKIAYQSNLKSDSTFFSSLVLTDFTIGAGGRKFMLLQHSDIVASKIFFSLRDFPVSVKKSAPKRQFDISIHPNPFNPSTTIEFSLSTTGATTVSVFDGIGRQVGVLVNEVLEGGKTYRVKFDGSSLSAGIYFVRLQHADGVQTKRMLMVK